MSLAASSPLRLLPLGDAAWTVELGEDIGSATHARVMGFSQALRLARQEGSLPGVSEWVPAFRSVTVYFDPLQSDADALSAKLLQLAENAGSVASAGRRWRLPVCFGGEAGPDLAALAAHCGLPAEKIIERLTTTVFHVYMLGFMPGFPYMGGLPSELAMPRLASPRKAVPARSLAVAGALCAIYPWESPGGWRLLGRTPVPPFDANHADSPTLFAPGDEVMWQAIDASTCARLELAANHQELERSNFLIAPEAAWPA